MTALNKMFIEDNNRVVAMKSRLTKLVSILEDQNYLLESLTEQMPDSLEKNCLKFFEDKILSLLEDIDEAVAK